MQKGTGELALWNLNNKKTALHPFREVFFVPPPLSPPSVTPSDSRSVSSFVLLLRLLDTSFPELLPDCVHNIRKRVSEPHLISLSHIRATSEPHPSHIRATSKPSPCHIRITSKIMTEVKGKEDSSAWGVHGGHAEASHIESESSQPQFPRFPVCVFAVGSSQTFAFLVCEGPSAFFRNSYRVRIADFDNPTDRLYQDRPYPKDPTMLKILRS